MMMFSNPEISGSIPTPRSKTGATRPPYGRRAAGGLVDAGQQPQQRRLPRTVVSDQAHPVAHPQLQRDVPQRLDDDDVGVASDGAPALPRNVFFSERVLASKMGNSTQASRVSMI